MGCCPGMLQGERVPALPASLAAPDRGLVSVEMLPTAHRAAAASASLNASPWSS